MTKEEEEEIPEVEERRCPECGGVIQVVKMDHRFLGRYTCPHCSGDILISD
jgi:ssDNA-binding Zn-finger/Zn-ribbon topoisomerase 1